MLRLGNDETGVKFYCDYEGTIARETVIDVDWFVQGNDDVLIAWLKG